VTEQFLNCAHQPKRGSKRGAAQHRVLQGVVDRRIRSCRASSQRLTLGRFKSAPLSASSQWDCSLQGETVHL
jgi:hypothetical protein